MACTANKAPFLRVMAKRGLSASASPRPLGKAAEVQSSVLGNKVVVASANSALPVTRVSIVFRAGSRFENYDSLGATHMMRIAAGLSTRNSTGFAIARNIQQIGGHLSATSDRETLAYTVETTADNIEVGLHYLQDLIQPAFKPWELADSVAQVKTQASAVPPQVRAVELLHKAAFRTGLGNSVYIPKFKIGNLSSETLLHFAESNCTANRCAVVGVGIDHNTLSGFAQSLDLHSGSGSKSGPASYYGGDARKDTRGNIAHVAVAGQGGKVSDQKEALAFAVLQQAVGTGPVTKYGNFNGPFGKAVASVDASVSFAPLNVSYTDAGLFGFVISTDAEHICKAVELLSAALKSGAVSNDDINRGKAKLKAAFLNAYATDRKLINQMSSQALLQQKVQSVDAILAAIDEIKPEDVQEAAKKCGSSKLSVGAVGNLGGVPYASEL